MLYGHPELTSDRTPPADLVKRLAREWPKIRIAWHNEWSCWILVQEPFPNHGQPWDFALACNNPVTGNPKEIGSWIFRFLELNDPRKNDFVEGVRSAQKKASEDAGKRRAAWRRQEVSERIARNLRPDLSPVAVSDADPVRGAKAGGTTYRVTDGGLLVPRG